MIEIHEIGGRAAELLERARAEESRLIHDIDGSQIALEVWRDVIASLTGKRRAGRGGARNRGPFVVTETEPPPSADAEPPSAA